MPDDTMILAEDAKAIIERYRTLAEAAISDAESWLRHGALSRAISEAIPDAIIVTSQAGLIVWVNARFELMFGYHRSEITGQAPEVLVPEAVRPRHVMLRREYSEDPGVRDLTERMTFRAVRKNGAEINVMIRLGPVVIPDGIYTIAVIRKTRD
ncbi:MAG TPA: PAS domain S-box protein [Rhodopila sp.]|jgi:PAS domain S-box-containing protein